MGLAIAIAKYNSIKGEDEARGTRRAHDLSGGSRSPLRPSLVRSAGGRDWVPNLPAFPRPRGMVMRYEVELFAAAAIPAESGFRWETASNLVSVNLWLLKFEVDRLGVAAFRCMRLPCCVELKDGESICRAL